MPEPNPFETHSTEYDAWFDENAAVYESELLAIRELLPPAGDWVEIGVGSGRFASRLGIPLGIEPAQAMAALARTRGVEVLAGRAEALPLDDASVDAAFLITTLCFVDDVDRAVREVARVLRPGGHAIVAFLPADSRLGELYCARASEDRFFRHATLPAKQRVFDAIGGAGLEIERTVQTLTGMPERANERIERPTEGHARGSFIVIRAAKRCRAQFSP